MAIDVDEINHRNDYDDNDDDSAYSIETFEAKKSETSGTNSIAKMKPPSQVATVYFEIEQFTLS